MRSPVASSFVSPPLPAPSRRRTPRRHLARAIVALAATAALAGCGQSEPTSVAPAALPPASPGFDVAGLVEVMIAPPGPEAAEDFLDSLPAPGEREVRQVANRHRPGRTDRVDTLRYPGVELEVYRVGESSARLPLSVRITHEDVGYRGLRVGMSVSEARALLHDATELVGTDADASFQVERAGAAPHQVDLESRDGALTAVTFRAYLD